MPAAVHWDDVEGARRTVGHLDGTWFDLGSAAGSREVGVQRIRVEPGAWSTPAHVEHGEAVLGDLVPLDGLINVKTSLQRATIPFGRH